MRKLKKAEGLMDKLRNSLGKIEMDKKGQIINTMTATFIGVFIFIFVIFAVLFGISVLNPSSFFTAGSAEANATSLLQANLTEGAAETGGQLPNMGRMFAVILVLAVIVILILYVRRMQAVGGTSAGGL